MTQAILTASNLLHIPAFTEWFRDMARSYAKNQQSRQTYKELSKLSDRELNDIGISRSDIRAVAYDLFWRD